MSLFDKIYSMLINVDTHVLSDIVIGIFGFIGGYLTYSLRKRIENHKIRLKKSEDIFKKQLESLVNFSAIVERLEPYWDYGAIEMNQDVLCEQIAQNFQHYSTNLMNFIAKYSNFIPKKSAEDIRYCRQIAEEYSDYDCKEPFAYSKKLGVLDGAEEFYKKMKLARDEIRDSLFKQIEK